MCKVPQIQHFSIGQMTFNPLKEAGHLVVFEKANKHCNPAASVCKPKPLGTARAKSFCRHPSYYLFHHVAQLLRPVSSPRRHASQLCPAHDVILKNITELTLPRFCCVVYQPVDNNLTAFHMHGFRVPSQRKQWMCKVSLDVTWSDIWYVDKIRKLMKCYWLLFSQQTADLKGQTTNRETLKRFLGQSQM